MLIEKAELNGLILKSLLEKLRSRKIVHIRSNVVNSCAVRVKCTLAGNAHKAKAQSDKYYEQIAEKRSGRAQTYEGGLLQ